MEKIYCFNCHKVVATVTDKIVAEYTWFSICSDCLFGVKGTTRDEMERLKKEMDKRRSLVDTMHRL